MLFIITKNKNNMNTNIFRGHSKLFAIPVLEELRTLSPQNFHLFGFKCNVYTQIIL